MIATTRPTIAWHCAKRWTEDDDRKLRAQLALLRADIEEAGGPTEWIHTRLNVWLRQAPPKCVRPRPRPRARISHRRPVRV